MEEKSKLIFGKMCIIGSKRKEILNYICLLKSTNIYFWLKKKIDNISVVYEVTVKKKGLLDFFIAKHFYVFYR